MVNTVPSDRVGKPYFSLAMKKVPNGSIPDSASAVVLEELEDVGVLSEKVSAAPITIHVQSLNLNQNTVGLYASKVAEREANNEKMESVDVALLSIMWICLSVSITLSVLICVVFSCRRVITRSLKVQNIS
jgi:mannose/fructose/N-acetylgalactosamine-specific phosphotransferase system component IIC